MTDKRDKLGRRIPVFDRSAANKKAAKTRKEKHGTDDHARAGAIGGRAGKRGYFNQLKDTNPEALKELSSKAGKTGTKYFARLKDEDPEKLKELSAKGNQSPKRNKASVSGGQS